MVVWPGHGDARGGLNFHAGQKQAILNAIVAHEVHQQGLPWHYVLLAENVVHEWQAKGAHLVELLDYARLRPLASASLQVSLL